MKYDFTVSNAIILSSHNGYAPFVGSVAVRGERIALVTQEKITDLDGGELIDGSGKILMPGLFNGHCHGDMTFARGLGDDLTLLEQNRAFAESEWFKKFITDEDRFYSRQLTYCEALLSGTTFIMENMYWGLGESSVDAMREIGIGGALAEDARADFSRPDELLSPEELERFAMKCGEAGIVPVVGGISEEDYEPDRLRAVFGLCAKLGIRQTCHLAETPWRIQSIRDRFSTTPVAMLQEMGLLSGDLIGSHVVHLTQEEIEYLAASGTKVVNTPLCEMKIQDGIAPIPRMVRAGVTVCLGTDGAMWNNSNDIFREMKGMALLHTVSSGIRSLSARDVLDMATINGARAFGLEKELGSIETGKRADFILIDASAPHMRPLCLGERENVSSSVVFNATGRDVTDVFVRGRRLVEDGVLKSADVGGITEKVQQTAEKARLYLNK